MKLTLFNGISGKEQTEAVRELICGSTPRQDFSLMRFQQKQKTAQTAILKEEKQMEKEKKFCER